MDLVPYRYNETFLASGVSSRFDSFCNPFERSPFYIPAIQCDVTRGVLRSFVDSLQLDETQR